MIKDEKKIRASYTKLLFSNKAMRIPARLGNKSGVIKADENGNVYVTFWNGETMVVRNSKAPNKRGWVIVGQENGLVQVLESWDVFASPTIPEVGEHDHTWGKSLNVSWIRGEQFLPGLFLPNGDASIHYTGLVYWLDGAFHIIPEQDIDLSANIPTTGALFGLLEVDATGTISVLEGTPVDNHGLLTYADIPAPSVDKKPLLYAVKLYVGQTYIKQGLSFMESDLVDLRWSGYSAGGGGSAPVTTAANDFQVGDGAGSWIKKTLAEVITILRTALDSIYQAAGSYAASSHTHAASDVTSGTVATARLGSGTADATKRLAGDNTWLDSREVLTANRTYYVRTDGSDSNTGLTNSSGGAFLTIQKAIDTASALDGGIYTITIQIVDGTYTGLTGIICKQFLAAGITIQGNATTPANVSLTFASAQSGFTLDGVQGYTFKNFKMIGTDSNVSAINAINASRFYFSGLNFGSGWQRHLRLFNQAVCEVQGSYTISGGGINHWYLYGNSSVHLPFRVTGTITVSGTPAFSGSFVDVNDVSWILQYSPSWTFSGGATGKRYSATGNGVLDTIGGGANYFPGNVAGTTATGGQYL